MCVQAVKRTLSQLHTEIVALKSLSHPNILQLLHVELDAVYPKKSGEQVGWAAKEGRLTEGRTVKDLVLSSDSLDERGLSSCGARRDRLG